MPVIYVEENGRYYIDCTKAMWSTDQIHEVYKANGNFLSDVDFVIETIEKIIMVEYKNANIEGASNPTAFNPLADKKIDNIARKFYDSLIYLDFEDKKKPKEYIYILEHPLGDATSRRMVRNRIKSKLPFNLQDKYNTKESLIEKFQVYSIDEWNEDEEYKEFPLKLVE